MRPANTLYRRIMEEYREEVIRIRELLAAHPEGMSITEIAGMLNMNRNTVAKYMDILQIQGAVDGRRRGTSKVFYLSERLPVTSLRKVCTRPFFVVDQDGEIIDLNQEFSSLVTMTADQLIRHSCENLPIRFLEGGSPGHVVKAVLKGTEQRIRAQVRQGEKILTVMLLLIPVVFETGKPGVSVIVDLDNPSDELPRKNAASLDVMALLDDEIEYVIRRTAEGITRYVNEPYCRAAGKTREELIGRPFKPLVSPEDADRIRVHIAGLSAQYPVGTIDYRVVMANGELRYQRWQDRALFNARGELDTINSFGIDITEQVLAARKLKKVQETLEESIVHRTEELRGINRQLYSEIAQRERMEEQLLLAQFAMDKATDMVFWISQTARIGYANDIASEALQYNKNELLDRIFGDIVPMYSLAEWDALWNDLKNGQQVSRELQLVKKDGTRFPAEVRLTYLEYRGKQFVYCSSRDLSERMRMDRALKEANRKLSITTSIARHDIQNKITVLLAYLGRTKKAITDPLLLDYLNRLEQAAKAIRAEINLTRDFKDMGLRPPKWQSIPSIVAAAVSRYEQKSIRSITDLPEVEIYADGQLDRVFDRLFENSQGQGKGATEIRIHYQIKDGALCIIFEDNGPGFPAGEKSQIFELQGNDPGNRGLFIAREILSLTGISLTEDGEPGNGARFKIRIPDTYYRIL
ncbi:MAG: PAS domain S-box protein [Methanoregula sp.]|nr:PAS domain S-box protein [Methanoregula sp.]